MSTWNMIKSKFLDMTVEEKLDYYKCGANFKTLNDIVDWGTHVKSDEDKEKLLLSVASKNVSMETATTDESKANSTVTSEDQSKKDVVSEKTTPDESKAEQSVTGEDVPKTEITMIVEGSTEPPVSAKDIHKSVRSSTETPSTEDMADPPVAIINFPKNDVLNGKISLFTGDITSLEIDAIVNAANNALECGGGVDYAIHNAAGFPFLKAECKDLNGCDTGDAKITGGYKLPAKYVIHTVGPKGEYHELLSSCYKKSMDLFKKNKLETIAFPCISTGIYGYPNENAAAVALETIRTWLDEDEYSSNVKRVIFCLFLDADITFYHKLLPKYFPF